MKFNIIANRVSSYVPCQPSYNGPSLYFFSQSNYEVLKLDSGCVLQLERVCWLARLLLWNFFNKGNRSRHDLGKSGFNV